MSDKHNIRLPDGTTLSIPAWASDVTMSNLARQMDLNLDFQNAIFKEIKGLVVNGEELTTAVKKAQDQDVKQREQIAKAETQSRKDFAKTLIKRTNDIVGRLSDTEKPLSTGVDMLGEFKDSLGDNSKSAADGRKKLTIFQRIMKAAGSTANLGVDASLVYAGFMAAKLEEFSKAQTNMIDAGAIFYNSASEFDTMFRDSRSLGITYNAFSEIVSQYGSALQGLGTGVSDGTSVFLDTFKAVDTLGEDLGDFGLRSQQIAQGLAEYVNVQRLTGAVDRNTINASEKLSQGFSELMVETTALAQLTGKSRNKIIQDRLAVMQDANVVAAMNMVRDASGTDAANQLENIFQQLADVSDEMPEQSQLLVQAIAKEAMSRQGNVQGFDIRTFLTAQDPTFMSILDQNSPIIDNINQAIRTGETLATDNESFIIKGFAELDLSAYNAQQMLGQGNSDFFNTYMELQKAQMLLQRNHKNRIEMSDSEYTAYVEEARSKLPASGSITETMNEVTQQFLMAQDALTFPINEAADVASSLSEALKDMAEYFDREETLSSDPETSDQAMSRQREAAMSETQVMSQFVAPSMSEEEMRRQGSMTAAPDPNQYLMEKSSTFPTSRYRGGKIEKDQEYMVGETGVERFVAKEAGYMYSHKDTLKMFQEETSAIMKAAQAVSEMHKATLEVENKPDVSESNENTNLNKPLEDDITVQSESNENISENKTLTDENLSSKMIDSLLQGMMDTMSPVLDRTVETTNEYNADVLVNEANKAFRLPEEISGFRSGIGFRNGGLASGEVSQSTYDQEMAAYQRSLTAEKPEIPKLLSGTRGENQFQDNQDSTGKINQTTNTEVNQDRSNVVVPKEKPLTNVNKMDDNSTSDSNKDSNKSTESLKELYDVKQKNIELAAQLSTLIKTFKSKNRSGIINNS
jgi:hypothetical protein